MGLWVPDAAAALRLRADGGRPDLKLLFNINAEFASPLGNRSIAQRARNAVFSSLADVVLVSGPMTGEAVEVGRAQGGQGGGARHAGVRQYRGRPSTASPRSWRSATGRWWARISRSRARPSTGSSAAASRASWTRCEACADHGSPARARHRHHLDGRHRDRQRRRHARGGEPADDTLHAGVELGGRGSRGVVGECRRDQPRAGRDLRACGRRRSPASG